MIPPPSFSYTYFRELAVQECFFHQSVASFLSIFLVIHKLFVLLVLLERIFAICFVYIWKLWLYLYCFFFSQKIYFLVLNCLPDLSLCKHKLSLICTNIYKIRVWFLSYSIFLICREALFLKFLSKVLQQFPKNSSEFRIDFDVS